jgi:choice-of-anchor B domain-containing protein
MKFSLAVLALPIAVQAAQFSKSEYASGAIHQKLMKLKADQWDHDVAEGKQDSRQWKSWKSWKKGSWGSGKDKRIKCKDGLAVVEQGNANQTFRCNNMDLYDFVNHADMGGPEGQGSSSWGWTARNGREFGIVGQFSGAAFVEILKDGQIQYMGRLPAQSVGSRWREIRVLNDYVIIGSEAVGHNVQIFDMKKLLDVSPDSPKTFDPKTDLVGLWDELPIGRTHNVVVDWDNEYILAVGAQPRNQTCKAGLQYIDLANPGKPTSPGCASQDGYVHDAQCVTYNGPDRKFRGRNICIGYNEDTVTVYDSTMKNGNPASEVISTLSYPGATYCHQGWWTERNWHQYVLLNDELDEQEAVGPAASGRPVTHIIDFTDLRNPKATGTFYATDSKGIDHNLYIVDGLAYQSNYGAGIWVHDVRSISKDPTGKSVKTEGFFDIYPEDDSVGGIVQFVGTWSHFLFPSGYILVNTIERGAFTVKLASGRGAKRGPGHGGKSKGKGR